jgi:hypothetical protein
MKKAQNTGFMERLQIAEQPEERKIIWKNTENTGKHTKALTRMHIA